MKIPLEKSELDKLCYISGGIVILIAITTNALSVLKYGKLAVAENKDKKKIGWKVPARVTYRFGFLPTLIVPWIVYFSTESPYMVNFPNIIAMGMYYLHYFNRCIIYPSKVLETSEPTSLQFFFICFCLSSFNTFLQFYYLLNVVDCSLGYGCTNWTLFYVVIFLVGFAINVYHDNILTSLKAEGKGYQIPRGCLFEYISSANFLGEIIEWWAYAMVTKSAPQILFAIWCTNFLVNRSQASHKFYKQKFSNKYPNERKAIIPFLY